MEKERVPEDVKTALKAVIDHFQKEDQTVRERQIRLWRSLKLYWDGFQRIWYSEVAHDWRIADETHIDNTDQSAYDKPVNVFKAYLESIIAALSVTTPQVYCVPDDADNPLDLSTAKAGNKIAELVGKHNNSPMLWLHALFIYMTEGMIAGYNYSHESEEYGTFDEKEYEDKEVESYICPSCHEEIDPSLFQTPSGMDELGQPEVQTCPECGIELDPMMQPTKRIENQLVGITKKPKSRQCIDVFGGLYIKVPNYARKQKDCPYLFWSYETHFANVKERYPWVSEKNLSVGQYSGLYEPYERWGRISTQYRGEYPINNITVRNCWLRPSSFYVLEDEQRELLEKKYPDGCKVVLANDELCEAVPEKLDDHWTLSYNPMSDYIHHDPLGLLLVPIQDITNELVSLTLQTIEHGIPQTFADPSVLDFDSYRQTETAPGMIFPAKARTGRTLSEGFYEIKTAQLSQEVGPFAQNIQSMGQMVSGALPSLFGGDQANSSKTAAQYSMSRSQALQRLQNVWKMLGSWWKDMFGKVIPAYINDVVEDERMVEKDDNGNFVNVFIRKAELQGKIGSIELETSEELPMTFAQKKDTIMQFLAAANPVIMQALVSPENIPFLAQALGISEFSIPGEDDRNKQYEEIQQLTASEPIGDMPSVEAEQFVDNHLIHIEICKKWANSDAGRLAKVENPLGYMNVLLHGKQHIEFQLMSAPPPTGEGGEKAANDKVAAPAKGEFNGDGQSS